MATRIMIMMMKLKMMYLQKYSSQGQSSRPLWRFQKASPQSRSRLSKTAFEQTPRLMMMMRSGKQIFNKGQKNYPDRFAQMRRAPKSWPPPSLFLGIIPKSANFSKSATFHISWRKISSHCHFFGWQGIFRATNLSVCGLVIKRYISRFRQLGIAKFHTYQHEFIPPTFDLTMSVRFLANQGLIPN